MNRLGGGSLWVPFESPRASGHILVWPLPPIQVAAKEEAWSPPSHLERYCRTAGRMGPSSQSSHSI